MRAVPVGPLRGLCQERQRELQLGGRRIGDDARLRGNDDALRPAHLLLHSRNLGHRVRFSDLRQDEHRRGRYHQVDSDTCRRVPVPDRRILRIPGLLRLPYITETARRSQAK